MVTFQEAFADAEASVDDVALDVSDPIEDGGQVGGESEVADSDVVAPSYFDIDAHGDQLVRIKVNGEELEVPLKELPSGYMRQSAFTQKTQELAADRARLSAAETLARAYEQNPHETVRILAEQTGLTLAQAQAQAEQAVGEQEDSWANESYVDPRVQSLDTRLAAIEQREARIQLEDTIRSLGDKYGSDFDAREVVEAAYQQQTTDLESVYKQIAFDRLFARQQAAAEFESQKQQKDSQVLASKQTLAQTVTGSQSFQGAGSTTAAPIRSVADALNAAMAEAGFEF